MRKTSITKSAITGMLPYEGLKGSYASAHSYRDTPEKIKLFQNEKIIVILFFPKKELIH